MQIGKDLNMRTNLVFKRTVNIEGSSRTEMKIIEVDIPDLKSSEGWTLVSNADKVSTINLPRIADDTEVDITINRDADADKAAEFLNTIMTSTVKNFVDIQHCNCAQTDKATLHASKENLAAQSVNVVYKPSEIKEAEEAANIKEYPSPIEGTACLIRKNNTIRIAYRKGKNSSINTPNRICINDRDKQSFFNAVRACNPTSIITEWCLTEKDHHFKHWNAFMDNEYQEQKRDYIRIETMEKKK